MATYPIPLHFSGGGEVDIMVTSALHRKVNDHTPPLPRKRLLPSARRALQRTWSPTPTPPPFWEALPSHLQRQDGSGWPWVLHVPPWRVEECGRRQSHLASKRKRGRGGHGLYIVLLEKWMGCAAPSHFQGTKTRATLATHPIHFSRKKGRGHGHPFPSSLLEMIWECLWPQSTILPEGK